MPVRIGLPKGRLLAGTATLLEKAGWGLTDYHERTRYYRLQSSRFPDLSAKIFHEKDIPIQVAIGNYDLGICGLDWVAELMAKYPSSGLVKIRELGYGESVLYLVASKAEAVPMAEMQAKSDIIRIASEYPNLAESFALKLRLRRFCIFPIWGAAEVYPPENADLVLISGRTGEEIFNHHLVAVTQVLGSTACLIANRDSWEAKDLSEVVASLEEALATMELAHPTGVDTAPTGEEYAPAPHGPHVISIALPDGHQQAPTQELLQTAGIQVRKYLPSGGSRRPASNLDGVRIKVVRPQDMPLQVANGHFDLAITGKDWLLEHLYQFPSSPVAELLDLKYGWVKIVAVVSKGQPATDRHTMKQLGARQGGLRVASEYVNVADKYARDNHLGIYRVIPTWGVTEAFLPEDADLLIENTQTGQTLARHNLKIVDTLFESTARLIANTDSLADPAKREKMTAIVEILRKATEAS
ncbi:MAG: ATP phosphoribosyltransferase [Chloroflexi bacterium]|nr:ATP phosphoribosyltransferase [Chloroflexota bacterium]